MYAVLNTALVAHVVDHDGVGKLSYSLDTAFALFQAGRVPGKVDINQGLQSLEVKAFAGSVGSDKHFQLPVLYHCFEGVLFHFPEYAVLVYAASVSACG